MDSILIREQYKVVQAVYAERDYAVVEAVDIRDKETPVYLLNLYEGPFFHSYGKLFACIRQEDFPGYHGVFLTGETLVAVFDTHRGVNIDELFYTSDNWDWRVRLEVAEALLHTALTLVNLPAELSCPLLLSENILFRPPEPAVTLRYMVRPMEGVNPRELVLLTADNLKKILPRRVTSQDAELDFMERLDQEVFPSVVPLYSAWREARERIREEYAQWEEKGFIRRWFSDRLRWVRRALKRR